MIEILCDELEQLIARDMGLSYKLFRYLNSTFFARANKVTSVKQALVDAKGRLAGYIELVRSYETGQWERVSRLSHALKLDGNTLPAMYLQACQWSDIAAKSA